MDGYAFPRSNEFMKTAISGVLLVAVVTLLAVPIQTPNLYTPEGRQNQIILNTSKIETISTRQQINEARISNLESRMTSVEQQQGPQNVTMATLALKVDELNAKFYWALGLLITLLVGFIGRVVWDVVGSRPKGEK
jgi:hypothetical protein